MHGVVRVIKKNQWFEEFQMMNDVRHGFSRLIWHDGRYETVYYKEGIHHGPEHFYNKDGGEKYVQYWYEGEKGDSFE